jgi:predicted transcriptional regulator
MTKEQIDSVLERVRTWPQSRKEEAAEMLLALEALGGGLYRLSDEEDAAVRRGLEEARNGEFATDEEVKELFDRYRR